MAKASAGLCKNTAQNMANPGIPKKPIDLDKSFCTDPARPTPFMNVWMVKPSTAIHPATAGAAAR